MQVRVHRNNIDECFDFIIELLDKAMPDLPLINPSVDEYGRVNKAICAAFKAKVAVYAASPLFNGNSEQAALVDTDGTTRLFPEKTDDEKLVRWTAAMEACREAIAVSEEANISLYEGDDITYRMTDSLKTTLTLRNAFNQKWNSELIWGNTQPDPKTMNMYHKLCMPILNGFTDMLGGYIFIGVPLKIAEQFYTVHGLPIANDSEWANINPMDLRVGDDQHAYYISKGYTTIKLNFDREPRYYASLGFDGGNRLGQLGNFNDLKPEDVHYVACRMGGTHAKRGNQTGPVTGFFPKKHFPIQVDLDWQQHIHRLRHHMVPLADDPSVRPLPPLCLKAINEAEGPGRSAQ